MRINDQTTEWMTQRGRLSPKPHVVKVFRHRSKRIQAINPSITDVRSNITIHTTIGLSNRTSVLSTRTEPIITGSSVKNTSIQRYSFNGTRVSRCDLSDSQSYRNQVNNNNEKKDVIKQAKKSTLDVKQENNEEVKKNRITSTTRTIHDQDITHHPTVLDNRNDLRSTTRLSSRLNFPQKSRVDSAKQEQKRQKVSGHLCRCSRLCIFFSLLAAILLATAIAAALISVLNKPNTTTNSMVSMTTISTTTATTITTTVSTSTTTLSTTTTTVTTTTTKTSTTTSTFSTKTTTTSTTSSTVSTTTTTATTSTTSTTTTTDSSTTTSTTTTTDTSTTTTTETTTITYVPTGIYALQIPTCATWNQTGITVAGNTNGVAGSGTGSLYTPVDIFVDNNYTLYVCDRDNNRIMKYGVNATTGSVVAGTGTLGSSSTQLNQPKGVAVDQMGAVIVADSGNYRIQRFPSGSLIGTTLTINSSVSILGQTRDLHIDVNNAIYVTDSDYSRIVKYYPNNGIGVIIAGSSGSGSAANQFSLPFGNFMDENQTLYVADNGNSRVQKWPAGATSGITVAGITGSLGSNLTQLNQPMAVIVDNNGYIYIADNVNNRIVRWTNNYTAGGICIVGCTGTSGAAPTQLNGPRDLKFDASGNLYVSDQGNNRVQKFMIQI